MELTLEERFEKIISYVKDNNYAEVMRHFNMPSYVSLCLYNKCLIDLTNNLLIKILTSFRDHGSPTRKSQLETLPTDILLNIVSMLTGNQQIMAALVCKSIAAVVETSTVRKIGNITIYRLNPKDPAYGFGKDTDREKWHECGFESDPKPALPSIYRAWYGSHFHVAIMDQWKDLRKSVGIWLGPKYRFCEGCYKFRLIDKKFWRALAEYENPGITKKVVKRASKKGGKKTAADQDSAAKVEATIDTWHKGPTVEWVVPYCPAHELLRERNGERVLKKVEYES